MKLVLVRYDLGPDRTFGVMFDNTGGTWHTLEDTVREGEKIPGKTAIPYGQFKVQVTYSPKFARLMPVLLEVPGFSGIRIHAGNIPEDTEGCILVGRGRMEHTLVESRLAYSDVLSRIQSSNSASILIQRRQ